MESDDRNAPNSLARNAPIGTIFQHIRHSAFAPSRQPLDLFNFAQTLRPQRFVFAVVHRNKPLRRGAIDHGFVRTPAVFLHQFDDFRIGFENEFAREMLDFRSEFSGVINRTINRQTVTLTDVKVVRAVSGRGVN